MRCTAIREVPSRRLAGSASTRGRWPCARVAACGLALAAPAAAQTIPPPAAIGEAQALSTPSTPVDATAAGHGTMSIAYQNTFDDGMFLPVPGGKVPIGTVRIQSLSLGIDYFFAEHWSGHVDLPFVDTRYRGNMPHCITTEPPQCQGAVVPVQPHPESAFLDDGRHHGTWQDWHVGVAYHADVDDFLLSPSLTATLPSHHYTFFAQSAPGQDLWKLEVALDMAHQFELSNVYYRVRLGHVFAQKTLGQTIDHNRLDLELGDFVTDAWTIKTFATAKKGHGYTGGYDQTTEAWYRHDQRAKHDYLNVGAGLDWHVDEKDTLSTTVQRLVWGQFVFDFKYSVEMRLSRDF